MATQTNFDFRHSLRPLSVFSFCGQAIAESRGDYLRAVRDLPPCPDCQYAQNRVARVLGGKHRLATASAANGSLTAT